MKNLGLNDNIQFSTALFKYMSIKSIKILMGNL